MYDINYSTPGQIRFENNRRWIFIKADLDPLKKFAGKTIDWYDTTVTLRGWREYLGRHLKISEYHMRALLHSDDIEQTWSLIEDARERRKGQKRSTAVTRGNATRRRVKRQEAIKEGRSLPMRPKQKRGPGRPRVDYWTLDVLND